MPKRRSMSQALQITDEKVAFIRGANSLQQTVDDGSGTSERNTNRTVDELSGALAIPNPSRAESGNSPETEIPAPEPLVTLTTRLRASTAEALRRAYLEQKLRRRQPATQQEIVEEALVEWLAARRIHS